MSHAKRYVNLHLYFMQVLKYVQDTVGSRAIHGVPAEAYPAQVPNISYTSVSCSDQRMFHFVMFKKHPQFCFTVPVDAPKLL